jgi:hypothetical protein
VETASAPAPRTAPSWPELPPPPPGEGDPALAKRKSSLLGLQDDLEENS